MYKLYNIMKFDEMLIQIIKSSCVYFFNSNIYSIKLFFSSIYNSIVISYVSANIDFYFKFHSLRSNYDVKMFKTLFICLLKFISCFCYNRETTYTLLKSCDRRCIVKNQQQQQPICVIGKTNKIYLISWFSWCA